MYYEPIQVKLKNDVDAEITDIKPEYQNDMISNYFTVFDEIERGKSKYGSDVGILLSYTKESYEEEVAWFNKKLQKIENDEQIARVAVVAGHPVGLVDIRKGGLGRRHMGEIGIFIRKDYRGMGVGKALMEDVLKLAKGWVKIAVLSVFEENKAAYNLYKKLGFEEYGRLEDAIELRNKKITEIWMYKRL